MTIPHIWKSSVSFIFISLKFGFSGSRYISPFELNLSRFTVNSPFSMHRAISPSFGLSDLSITSISPFFIPASSIEFPEMRIRNVEFGRLIRISARFIFSSCGSPSGEG